MPNYDYRCNECQLVQEVTHSIKENPDILCPRCNGNGKEVKMERLISLNRSGGFIFKQWTESQCYKIGRDKRRQNSDLDLRQIERYGSGPSLRPNVAGMEVDSWKDAKKLAGEAGMSTSSYDAAIKKEESISKISGVDDRKWKAVKEAVS